LRTSRSWWVLKLVQSQLILSLVLSITEITSPTLPCTSSSTMSSLRIKVSKPKDSPSREALRELKLALCMGIPLFPGYPITVCNQYISMMYISTLFFAFANIYNCKHLLFSLLFMMYLLSPLLHS